MTAILIVGAAIASGCWYLLYRSQQRLAEQLTALDAQLAKPLFRCVVIEAGTEACTQIRSLPAQPMLLDQAPILPLTGCDVAKCGCHFIRLDDRRSGVDRRVKQMLNKKSTLANANKRFVKDRRINSIQATYSKQTTMALKRKQLARNVNR